MGKSHGQTPLTDIMNHLLNNAEVANCIGFLCRALKSHLFQRQKSQSQSFLHDITTL